MSEKRRPGDSDDGSGEQSVVGDLHLEKPVVDIAAMLGSEARVRKQLFDSSEPTRLLHSYVLLGPVASGGMGAVYSAYDTRLDRRVALKQVHPSQGNAPMARERLLGEARALAQLTHPNVVRVHDVLDVQGDVVMVMELVEGHSLAEWERERSRSWREIMPVYRQAGEGLAAAHEAGIVHRDFKPSNVVMGKDGRVRVVDFGLAQQSELAPPADRPGELGADGERDRGSTASASAPIVADGLTVPGQVLGTPEFVAPERTDGKPATPASDQYSFCVALRRALYGAAPRGGGDAASTDGLHDCPVHGHDGRRVPRWLRALVARGLTADPSARFPSMKALLRELERERGWRRWRFAMGSTAAMAAGAALAWAVSGGHFSDDCDGVASDEIARVWSAGRRAAVVSALSRAGVAEDDDMAKRVMKELDGYQSGWRALRSKACEARRRGTESDALYDRRTVCLTRLRQSLDAGIYALEQVDSRTVRNALLVVAGFPAVAACEDVEALLAGVPPPTSTWKKDVERIQEGISKADALDRAVRLPKGVAADGRGGSRAQDGTAVAQARLWRAEAEAFMDRTRESPADRAHFAALLVEAAILEGKLLIFRAEFAAAVAPLRRAELVAFANGRLAEAIVAAARRLFAQGRTGKADLRQLEAEAAAFESVSLGLRGDHFARPLLLNNTGTLYMVDGDPSKAAEYFEKARDDLRDVDSPDLELTGIDQNLAMVTRDPERRAKLAQGAWERLRKELGKESHVTIQALYAYGHRVVDKTRSLPLIEQACDLYGQWHAELVPLRVQCLYYQAFLLEENDRRGAAKDIYAEVERIARGVDDPDTSIKRRLAAGYHRLLDGRPREALAEFERAIADAAGSGGGPWRKQERAHGQLGAGRALMDLGRRGEAMRFLLDAEATFREFTAGLGAGDAENALRLGAVRRAMRPPAR